MNIRKLPLIISIIISFIIMLTISIYEYKEYTTKTNACINAIVENIATNYPNVSPSEIIAIINSPTYEYSEVLNDYGFTESDFSIIKSLEDTFYQNISLNIIAFIIFISIILLAIYTYNKKQKRELNLIIAYLKELNKGNYNLNIDLNSEGLLSILKNEIYTTTIMLKEQAQKEYQDKIQLKDSLTNISHQLKTPLTSISLLVDGLLDSKMDAKTKEEFLNDINVQLENINRLIIVLLKLSRFDANVVTFKKEDINVSYLCNELLKYIDIIRDLKNITIEVEGDDSITFKGDYKWEFEALSNILKNCLEYTKENKRIFITFKQNNVYTEITIKDEGPGMSLEEQKNIFNRFYKGPNSSNNNFGIGLSLAKEIINKDNGTIKVSSTLNVGTTFKIRYYK